MPESLVDTLKVSRCLSNVKNVRNCTRDYKLCEKCILEVGGEVDWKDGRNAFEE